MMKYKVRTIDGIKQKVEADCIEFRDDNRIVFLKTVDKDQDPSGLEFVAMFNNPLSVVKEEAE